MQSSVNNITEIADMVFELRGRGTSSIPDIISEGLDSLFCVTEDVGDYIDFLTLKLDSIYVLAWNILLVGGIRSPLKFLPRW